MADNYRTKTLASVRADVYDPRSPTPDCIPDGTRYSNGHKVLTCGGYVWPAAGDYIVTKEGLALVVAPRLFPLLFEAIPIAPAKTAKVA